MPRNREEADLFFCSVTPLQNVRNENSGPGLSIEEPTGSVPIPQNASGICGVWLVYSERETGVSNLFQPNRYHFVVATHLPDSPMLETGWTPRPAQIGCLSKFSETTGFIVSRIDDPDWCEGKVSRFKFDSPDLA